MKALLLLKAQIVDLLGKSIDVGKLFTLDDGNSDDTGAMNSRFFQGDDVGLTALLLEDNGRLVNKDFGGLIASVVLLWCMFDWSASLAFWSIK